MPGAELYGQNLPYKFKKKNLDLNLLNLVRTRVLSVRL